MKKILGMIMLLTFCFVMTACGNAVDEAENSTTDNPSNVPENVLMATYKDENMNEVVLYQNDDESYGMVISLYRLAEIEGDATMDGDGFVLNGTDAAGQPITLNFYPDTDSYTLEVIESTWDLLPAGEIFNDFTPVLNGES